jgi:hypothetical protein
MGEWGYGSVPGNLVNAEQERELHSQNRVSRTRSTLALLGLDLHVALCSLQEYSWRRIDVVTWSLLFRERWTYIVRMATSSCYCYTGCSKCLNRILSSLLYF